MGLGGTIKFAWSGFVDIRLAMIILAGSLFGIQLGAIGTTYVKPYMVKVVMGVIMLLALASRAVVIPVYLSELEMTTNLGATAGLLKNLSFGLLIFALGVGAVIVLSALIKGMRQHRQKLAAIGAPVGTFSPPEPAIAGQLSPTGRMERIMLVTDGTEYSAGAVREAITLAKRCEAQLFAFTVLAMPDHEAPLAEPMHKFEKTAAVARLSAVQAQAEAAGVHCEILLGHGEDPYAAIAEQAEQSAMDVIVMGRRDKSDLVRAMLGSTTEKVIGHTHSDVLVVPRDSRIAGKGIVLPVDGSRHSDAAAITVLNFVKHCRVPVTVVSVAIDERLKDDARALAQRVRALMADGGVAVAVDVRVGEPAEAIVASVEAHGADLVVMGSHGRTGLDRLMVGSVSERVIGRSHCPVLVVKL